MTACAPGRMGLVRPYLEISRIMTPREEFIQTLEARLKAEKSKDAPNPAMVRQLEARIRSLRAMIIR